jgi:putative NADH-flavin reductase
MKIAILGATGTIGRAVVAEGVSRGHRITGQSRNPNIDLPMQAKLMAADPHDAGALQGVIADQDAVIYALGFRARGEIHFFSETTTALLYAMDRTGVRRLIAITGVGAGETRGHGGWFYDRVVYPLVTRNIYTDKERQEALIRASGVDWTILRPAPFSASPGPEPLHVLTAVKPGTRLSRVTPQEVGQLALDCAERGLYRGEAVFFGHGEAG